MKEPTERNCSRVVGRGKARLEERSRQSRGGVAASLPPPSPVSGWMTLFWVVPPVMGDEHCSVNERCDLWALGRSQDRVNQSLQRRLQRQRGFVCETSIAHSSAARRGCNFQTCVGYTKTGVPICPPIDADSIHRLTLVPENATGQDFFSFSLAMSCRCFLHARSQKKIVSSQRCIFFRV